MAAASVPSALAATNPAAAMATATITSTAAATQAWPPAPGEGDRPWPLAGVRWVLDRGDDHACMRALLSLHSPTSGVVACLAAPGSPWPVLARDLLLALGKDRRALAGAGPRSRLPELLAVWLRAEHVRHLVVLRAHLLPPETLAMLDRLASGIGIEVWVVAHADAPGTGHVHWTRAFALLNDAKTAAAGPPEPSTAELYGTVRDLARRAGRSWRLYTERTLVRPRWVRPDCALGSLLQNLTIDAHDVDELRLRLHATRAGLHDEGLDLALPALDRDTRLLRYLGPRFSPDTVARLRRLACPLAAGAFTLALATDNNAPWLAKTRIEWTDPHARHVRTYTGTFRIPPQARPMLRALLLDRASRPEPPPALFIGRDGRPLRGRRIAHRVGAASEIAGIRAGMADLPREKCYTPETFATPFTGATSIRPLTPAAGP